MATPSLFWQSHIFESPSISLDDVRNVVKDKLQEIGLSNAKINKSDVNGSSASTIVAVCFVQLKAGKFMAIVMAAGTDASTLVKNLIKKFVELPPWL